MSLADNLPANTVDRVKAVHGGTMSEAGTCVKTPSCRRKATFVGKADRRPVETGIESGALLQ
jgi:hypothetical protein